MSDDQNQNNDLRMDWCFIPCLESAARAWYEARHRFQIEPSRQHQDDYCKATDELGQSLSACQVEQPELFEQLKLWFAAHQDD
jgi:hypothetical protein